jgi:hypothetical protein
MSEEAEMGVDAAAYDELVSRARAVVDAKSEVVDGEAWTADEVRQVAIEHLATLLEPRDTSEGDT